MKYTIWFLPVLCLFIYPNWLFSATDKYEVKSPNGEISLTIATQGRVEWAVTNQGRSVVIPSKISLNLESGEKLGVDARVISVEKKVIDTQFTTVNYFRSVVNDHCNQLLLNFKGNYSLLFRVYNDAVAYRFITSRKDSSVIISEEANFNFSDDYKSFLPYMWDYRGGEKFNHSFEALYREGPISHFAHDSLAFLPLLVDLNNGQKAEILEADLIDYPGMYIDINETGKGFKAVFPQYPLAFKKGGYLNMNEIPTQRANYIARTAGKRDFPWRVVVISNHDKYLLDNDIIQRLASPCMIKDPSWIKPGLVSWDWWNDWNLSHVDFKAGYNTPTYKYYIDFAAENHLPYIVMDWGWSSKTDLFELTEPNINLKEIIDYGKQKGVGVVLWATWFASRNQALKAFPYYAAMGVKGFKIDFVDRDDQLAISSLYTIAKIAADNKLIIDYHGAPKPTGLQKTYPNVIGFEGVKGLENYKWANEDQPRYTVTIPYIRMMAGPMDYTPGSMRNVTKDVFSANNSMPMSKGTRCNQMAMYVIFHAPFQMLADNPVIYRKEQECTSFIAKMPVIADETTPLDGQVGEYTVLARKKDNVWYVGAMTNWSPRNLNIDFSFLGEGSYTAEIFSDGINADHDATDYKREVREINHSDKLNIQLAPGGGWVARIVPL